MSKKHDDFCYFLDDAHLSFKSSKPWKYQFRLDGSSIFQVLAKTVFNHFSDFRLQKHLKQTLKNKPFLASIFQRSGLRFEEVFGRFFGPKRHVKSKNTLLVKTLKIVLPSRRNWYFQGFEALSFERCCRKCAQKSHVFWDFGFDRILEGFWEGFGRPKSSIFALFSMFFRSRFWSALGKSQKSTQEAQQDGEGANLVAVSGHPPPSWGEKKRGDQEPRPA